LIHSTPPDDKLVPFAAKRQSHFRMRLIGLPYPDYRANCEVFFSLKSCGSIGPLGPARRAAH
jgi:hypothetical protein